MGAAGSVLARDTMAASSTENSLVFTMFASISSNDLAAPLIPPADKKRITTVTAKKSARTFADVSRPASLKRKFAAHAMQYTKKTGTSIAGKSYRVPVGNAPP